MKTALLLVAVLVVLPYTRTAVYDFPEPRAFSGPALFNPYAKLTGSWQRTNLHAHGQPWGPLTTGKQTAEELVTAYRGIGYAMPGISDYQHIAAQSGIDTMPIYEHGYNVGKRHQLAVGARKVVWFDFPLWQSIGQQQLIIDLVRSQSELVAIAHPEGRDAYSTNDMQRLTGYQLLEVVNGPFVGARTWDAALSSGRPVWAIANDDNHDLHQGRRFGTAWNMIDAPSATSAELVGALRVGRSYAVLREENDDLQPKRPRLTAVTLDGNHLQVSCDCEPSRFEFIGQNGIEKKVVEKATGADYVITDSDTYIRTVVRGPQATMFLNPIIRYDGRALPAPVAHMNMAGTWAMRASTVSASVALLWLLRRRSLAATAKSSIVGEADGNPA